MKTLKIQLFVSDWVQSKHNKNIKTRDIYSEMFSNKRLYKWVEVYDTEDPNNNSSCFLEDIKDDMQEACNGKFKGLDLLGINQKGVKYWQTIEVVITP